MVILGAGGFAKEILQVVEHNFSNEHIVFFDDITTDLPNLVFDKYPILRSRDELMSYFKDINPNFVLGVGNPKTRNMLCNMALERQGKLQSAISINAHLSTYSTVGQGASILSNANISNTALIGKAPLLYYNTVITHDCHIGDFVELSPGATLLGHVRIGDFTHIGANATVLPHVKIGNHCVVGASSLVTKDVPDYSVVAGVPARQLTTLS